MRIGTKHVSARVIALAALVCFLLVGATTASAKWVNVAKNGSVLRIDFASASKGFALRTVASGATRLSLTTNGGKTWTMRPANLVAADQYGDSDIDFISSKVGWFCGANGIIKKTTDAGKTWTTQTSGVTGGNSDVCFVDAKNGWVVGMSDDAGWYVLRTTDGGATWAKVLSDPEGYLQSLSFLNKKDGVVAGVTFEPTMKGRVYTTHDGGLTWKKTLVSDATKFTSACQVTTKIAWIGGYEDSLIYRTTDGGSTWKKFNTGNIEGYGPDVNDIFFFNKSIGWIVAGNRIFGTKNGGKKWSSTKLPFMYTNCVASPSASHPVIGSYEKGIWRLK